MHTVWVPEPPEASLRLIYEQILTGYLNHEIPALLHLFPTFGAQVVAGTTSIYSQVVQHLRPTPKKSHYTFNTRDVSNVFQGMLMVAKQHLLPAASTALDTVGTENVLDDAADSVIPNDLANCNDPHQFPTKDCCVICCGRIQSQKFGGGPIRIEVKQQDQCVPMVYQWCTNGVLDPNTDSFYLFFGILCS